MLGICIMEASGLSSMEIGFYLLTRRQRRGADNLRRLGFYKSRRRQWPAKRHFSRPHRPI